MPPAVAPPKNERTAPVQVVIATRDRVFARLLEDLLRADGIEVWPWSPDAHGSRELGMADVALVEIHQIGDPEWTLLERVALVAPLIELVAVTADPAVETAVRALRTGVFAVLEYPVSSDELARTVRAAAQRKQRAEQRIRQIENAGGWHGSAPEPTTGRGRTPT